MSSFATGVSKFETLNALRFFAFCRVFLLHIPNFCNAGGFDSIRNGGEIGVSFFFVLSGFLITYLLAKEKSASGSVDVKRFLMRRMLRIWPLYYLGVLLAYASVAVTQHYGIGSNIGYMPNILYSITFTENIKMLIEDNFPNGAPLRTFWSLCVEEQFYILWIIIFRFFNLKDISKVFGLLMVVACCYRIAAPYFLPNIHYTDIDLISNLDYFCMGGALGLIIVVYPDVLKKIQTIFTGTVQLLVICFGLTFLFFHQFFAGYPVGHSILFPTISAIIFTLLITCFILPFSRYQIPNHSFIGRLGNISYGLYVYNTPVILVLLIVFKRLNWQSSVLHLSIFVLLAFFATCLISALSYKYFEAPFLKFRSNHFQNNGHQLKNQQMV